ncbi:MAG TPA: SpoIIE family protein phosphatase [Bacteroidia bacterium]|nr:SpoIIE family protein phosphatase [Bacteroidia bacterium]
MKKIFSIIFLIIFGNLFSQLDSLKNQSHYKDHLTWSDTFFGSEDLYQVCYPKDHRSMFYFIIVFSITTVVFGLLIIYIKHHSNKHLKEKNEIIAEQNKDLIDSINYSQRIQQAILPDSTTEEIVLKNGFALYKPKHIVSGDFYWLHKCDDNLFFAVIDCTGHGVPGALLTMLAYNAINKAVIEKEIMDPTAILDSMNTEVKSALKQNKNNPIQDSMEVGIVCLNTLTNEINYAGANTSLTYIQNGELKIASAGKCSVGSVQDGNIVLPTTHSIKLNSGDCFYLYSDGFADQFGGPKGKKYKYKQLEELLKSNSNKTPSQQKELLSLSFENWKGKLEQVDDVTVLGYKIA